MFTKSSVLRIVYIGKEYKIILFHIFDIQVLQHWSTLYTWESEVISELASSDAEGKGTEVPEGKHCQKGLG